MADTKMQDAFRAAFPRSGPIAREHEIMRVACSLGSRDVIEQVRKEVLAWAQKRVGSFLPEQAWNGQDFEYLSGGRNCVGVRISTDAGIDIWALRTEDPDKTVPGRVWTTEVVLGNRPVGQPQLSVRLMASTNEHELDIVPHAPGLIFQLADKCGVYLGDYQLEPEPWIISSSPEVEQLGDMLANPERQLPVIILSCPENGNGEPLLDARSLTRATIGVAHIIVLPAEFTWQITKRFDKVRSVFNGSVRAYMPGFDETADPYTHRLFLLDSLQKSDGVSQCERWLRWMTAAESIRRFKLGTDVLSFAPIRNASLELKQSKLARGGASADEQLMAANARIVALEAQQRSDKDFIDNFCDEHDKAKLRAESAEQQVRASAYRIQQLTEQLTKAGGAPDLENALPKSWSEFGNWCDTQLAGRVVLSPAAKKMVKDPLFEDIAQAARCLNWLATDCRDRLINGGEGTLRDVPIEDGIRNAHCGNDAFDFDWQGQKHIADWHVKSGGNTRDPKRCLRIYYAWEPISNQIVIAEMPAHIRTNAT